MTGHLQILRARQQGYKPAAVFVMAGMEPMVASSFDEPEKALSFGLYPTVYVGHGELTQRHDLRFLTGLRVHVHAPDLTDEVLSFVEAIHASGAAHIIAARTDGTEAVEYRDGGVTAWTF